MPSFDPPGTVPEFEYMICWVYQDIQNVGDGCNLNHSVVNIRFPQSYTVIGTDVVDLAITEHPFSVSMRLRRGQ
jgi:hypothetical protein